MKTQLTLIGAAAALAACGGSDSPAAPAPASKAPRFVGRVDNPWFPLRPGTRYLYRGVKDGKRSRDVVTVTHGTKTIAGVRCTVVRDLLYLRGRLEERTTDWYAQDARGNVWYYGERTAELDARGRVTSREGSWQGGGAGGGAGGHMPPPPPRGAPGAPGNPEGGAP